MSIRYRLVFCQEKNNRLKMKINNVALPISLAVILTGCVPHASNRNITAIEVVKPAIGQSATAYMGDPIITSATGFKTDVLELGAANGALSSIAAGTYCSEGNGIYRNYHNPQAVALKNLYGQIGNYVDYVSYDAAKNEISPPNGTSYTASEISIKRVPDGLCRVSNSLVKEGANKQVISSQADSLIKISRIWADFFPANTSNQPI
ncbi:hypothetical protein Q2V18_09265 [Escherichia coli]|nr:hypothetical protein [Escherichia coli]